MNIAIVGAGQMGERLAKSLLEGDHSVTLIDFDEKVLQKIASKMDVMTVLANGKKVSTLKNIKISEHHFLMAVTGDDEVNITIAAFAKKLGCPHVLARVREPEHMYQLDFIRDTMNIDYIVNPDLAISNEIYKYLSDKYTSSKNIFTSGGAALLEVKAYQLPQLIDKPIKELHNITQAIKHLLIVAISRNGKVIVPHGDSIIKDGDSLYIIGEMSQIAFLQSSIVIKNQIKQDPKIMIVGGGKTGLYLAQKLSEFGSKVKIIEKDLNRCHYLAKTLDKVIILNGDASDAGLLEDENIREMDGFVTTTNFDEDNILLALKAKSYGIEDVIAKVGRGIYTDLVASLGVDMALNPLDIITSNILRIVKGSKKIIYSQLVQGQAEITEIVATTKMKLLGKPLKDLELPQGLLIGAIHRGADTIIPNGDTIIKNGDKVIIFSLLSDMHLLERFTK